MRRYRAGLWAVALFAAATAVGALSFRGAVAEGGTCHGDVPCPVAMADGDSGDYYVEAPEDWDGHALLPVIVWFHGYNGSGLAEISNHRLVQDWTEDGYLFVAADGRDNTWAIEGAPARARDDNAYVRAVIADVMAHYPTDPHRILAAGFSQGASMVWSVACFIGAPFTHYAPVSGDFWEPLPDACTAGPITMRHTHGTTDTTFPTQGRPIGGQWHQGDLFQGWSILRTTDGCAADPDRTGFQAGDAACMIWSSCDQGGLQLCFHDGGHMIPRDWSATTQEWIEWTLKHHGPRS